MYNRTIVKMLVDIVAMLLDVCECELLQTWQHHFSLHLTSLHCKKQILMCNCSCTLSG